MRKLYPPDDKLVINVCMSYRHDFGLMTKEEQRLLIFECKEWFRAIDNNININTTPLDNNDFIQKL